jgi:molybdate transport system substrate-binding protein
MSVKSWQFWLSLCLSAIVAISCTRPATGSQLLVAAAASLQPALEEIAPLYTRSIAAGVNYNFAASGILQQQIENGAPVDIFIAAADRQIDALQAQGVILTDTRQPLLTNQLVLITPKHPRVNISDFPQLVKPEVKRIAIGEPRTVPAGRYAIETFTNLGILDRVKSKFVLATNARAVLSAVATGSVDAGIVYLTDAKTNPNMAIVATADEKLHTPIVYPIAILKSSKSPQAARAYLRWLQSQPAIAIFKKYGFGIAQSQSNPL